MSELAIGCHECTDVEQMVIGNQELLPFVHVLLPHTAHASSNPPVVGKLELVFQVVVHGVEFHGEFSLIDRLLKFAAEVALITYNCLQLTSTQLPRVVANHLGVKHALRRQLHAIAFCRVAVFPNQFACLLVALALDDARSEIDVREAEPTVSPFAADTQHTLEVALLEPRSGHIAIAIIAVGMGRLVGEMPVPDKAADIACKTYDVFPQALVGLILTAHVHLQQPFVEHGFGMQNHDTCDGVATIHERSGALENLDRMDGFSSHFEAMLVAPLLAFLAYALIDHHHAIVAQASDHGLGDARACADLRKSRVTADGIDEVAACGA